MTVNLCFVFDTGYCLADEHGYLVCAKWFDTEQAAVEYAEKQGWDISYHEGECY